MTASTLNNLGNDIRCAIIGLGNFGKFHVQKLYSTVSRARLVAICDLNYKVFDKFAEQYQCQSFANYRDLISDKVNINNKIDAVIIATPLSRHYEMAKFFLMNDIHVFLEKPMTETLREADELIGIAHDKKLVLQIGYLERFSPIFNAVKANVNTNFNKSFIETRRSTTLNFRANDTSVILDLMSHDIDIVLSMVKSDISRVASLGKKFHTHFLDIASAQLFFTNGCSVCLNTSRVSSNAERILKIIQDDRIVVGDFINKRVIVTKKPTLSFTNQQLHQHFETPRIINVDTTGFDAIETELKFFIDAIINKTSPIVSGIDGRSVLRVALDITKSVKVQI